MTMAFRRIQIGKETTKGTAVAADKVLVGRLQATPTRTLHMPEDEERNSLALLHRRTVTSEESRLVFNGSLNFEQVIHFLAMGIKGGVMSDTPTGATDARDWTFVPNLSSANNQDSYTVEYGDNQQEYYFSHVMAEQLEFTYAMGEVVSFSANLFGNYPTLGNFTSGLSAPICEDAVANKTSFYVDNSWAGLGTTKKAGTLANASIRIPTGLAPVRLADGSLDFSRVVEGKRAAEVELTFLHNAEGERQFQNWADGDLAFVRLETEGSEIEAGFKKTFRIDLALRYTDSPQLFDEVSGLNALRLVGRTFEDPVAHKDFSVFVRNDETAL